MSQPPTPPTTPPDDTSPDSPPPGVPDAPGAPPAPGAPEVPAAPAAPPVPDLPPVPPVLPPHPAPPAADVSAAPIASGPARPEHPAAPVPPAQPPGYGAPGYGAPASASGSARTNVLAIVSLVSAFIVSLVAVITGHIALYQIKRTGEKGRGLAIGGLVLGYLGILSGIIAGIVVLVLITTGAFLASTIPFLPSPGYSSTPFEEPSPEPSSGPSAFDTLTFAAGNDLLPGTVPQFTDPFLADPAWTVLTPDNGDGTWAYTDPTGLCDVTFHQGDLDPAVTIAPGDDRATTERLLASILGSTAAELAPYLRGSSIAYGTGGSQSTVDTLSIRGSDDDGSTTAFAARAFGVVGAGLYFTISCASGGDVESVYDTVTAEAAIFVS